jgi:RHH-type proline utilization regulon transcriptional repressor/proline dehydrogenase/delta 1-pyrroline-5-carboxylate dehydrogenase
MTHSLASLHHTISARAFACERETVQALRTPLSLPDADIRACAEAWVRAMRAQGRTLSVETLLREYGLDTAEGVALMCLAEALLRIPDAATADALIHDKLGARAWQAHLGASDAWFVNAASWGLMLTGRVVQLTSRPEALLARISEPLIREALKRAMRWIGEQFVLGETMERAIRRARDFPSYRFSYDILGESARTDAQAQAYIAAYRDAVARLAPHAAGRSLTDAPGLSVKLSALHPRYEWSQRARMHAELLPRLKSLLLAARDANLSVSLDAEWSSRLDLEMDLFAAIAADPDLVGWNGLGFVLQAYNRRAFPIVGWLAQLARETGRIFPLRLVKGAYWDSEIKAAQQQGLPSYPVFTRKSHTDISYLACADAILQRTGCFFPQFATHNARTAASIVSLAERYCVAPDIFEFQRLHGMGEGLHDQLVTTHPCRIYAPVGPHKDLLAYLIRRLLENSANTSFVHLLADDTLPLGTLLADPLAEANGDPALPDPVHLYGAWRNSRGLDFGNLAQMQDLDASLQRQPFPAEPLPATISIVPCDAWRETSVDARAAILERAAGAIEESRDALLALLAREAGRILADGMAEIREAADFCRYYAHQARALFAPAHLPGPTGEHNLLSLHPRGTFLCISPWNFPLSIFTGQIVAALAAGNSVFAKPAEQTPRVAAFAVRLLHEAGVPAAALQLAVGPGETVGAALVADPRIDGVVFTGGMDTARHIQRALAAREGPIVPFIAETGGQNAMVVDSSALPEQAVDDILLSAFGSAGQRCSSLRVLYVQEEIADMLLELLAGAMRELRLCDPLNRATDIGPIIDAPAQRALLSHIERMRNEAKLIATVPLPERLPPRPYVAPHAFEIADIAQLTQEIFGPVLHVIRFRADELRDLPHRINATGYGLTFGIHSRIDAHIDYFLRYIRAGNLYVNRAMTGAVVGVQPFGGEGLSGTGPKTGGPQYLARFATERTISVNTAAIGGNVELLRKKE